MLSLLILEKQTVPCESILLPSSRNSHLLPPNRFGNAGQLPSLGRQHRGQIMPCSYIHDQSNKTIYRIHMPPSVTERAIKGRNTGWFLRLDFDIVRDDNRMDGASALFNVREIKTQEFGPGYSKEDAISYFLARHSPKGIEISSEEYTELEKQYNHLS